ncbi:cysteine synthase CysM [candidate division KSB1 bacterium]|nr:cysteine synthase CysM [candidate division KSB1 bacterium]
MKLTNLIGRTPLVDLSVLIDHPGITLLGKMEGNNPGSSVKDRAAYWMIKGAEEKGLLGAGIKIIEPTSGNTGIALAMIASARGYKIELVMPENSTRERWLTMQAFGAQVTLTPAKQSMEGAIDYARDQVEKGNAIMLDQFSNPDNPRAHYESTGPEIWQDTGKTVTHFISAMGTTGTIMGVSRYLKEQNQDIQIIGVRPAKGAHIPGIRRWPQDYMPAIFESSRVDTYQDITQEQAGNMARILARKTGVFCGTSAGGAVAAAVEVAKALTSGVLVAIICDRGDRYLSSDLFTDTQPARST